MSLNRNLTQKLFITFRSKKGLILKLGQLIKYYVQKIFRERNAENVQRKLVPEFLTFVIFFFFLIGIHSIQG